MFLKSQQMIKIFFFPKLFQGSGVALGRQGNLSFNNKKNLQRKLSQTYKILTYATPLYKKNTSLFYKTKNRLYVLLNDELVS